MISPERREEKRRERKGRDNITHSTGGSRLKIENKDKYMKVIKMKKLLSKKKERIKKNSNRQNIIYNPMCGTFLVILSKQQLTILKIEPFEDML